MADDIDGSGSGQDQATLDPDDFKFDGDGPYDASAFAKLYEARMGKPYLHVVGGQVGPFLLKPPITGVPDVSKIPARRWVYGTQLVRGYVSVLVAAGGTGKSAYAMAVGASIASGRPLLGERIHERTNVAILNLEDPMEELDRRLLAITLQYGLVDWDVAGRLILQSGEDRPLCIAALDNNNNIIHPDEDGLIATIIARKIGVLIVDPYAESHSLEENSNPQMVAAAACYRRVARKTGCAVLLIHHVRKGVANTIEAARGAKALTDSARVGLLMTTMTDEDGEKLGIDESERRFFVRLDDAKTNMAPRGAKARWFRLESVPLGNAEPDYPDGDQVAAITPHTFASAVSKGTPAQFNDVLDLIAAAPPDRLYAPYRKGRTGNLRWCGWAVLEVLDCTPPDAAAIVATWLRTGLLETVEYKDADQRRMRTGVRVNHTKRPTI